MHFFKKALAVAFFATLPMQAAAIRVDFTAQITTVSGDFYGVTSANNGTAVTGFFEYDTDTPDTLPGDLARGWYEHAVGTSDFQVNLPGVVVSSGNGTAFVQVEDFGGADTFRFREGDCPDCGGSILVDGHPDPDALLNFAFSGSFFTNDLLPTVFPFTGSEPHTMAISNANSTVLLQFQTLTPQAVPEPSTVLLTGVALLAFAWRRRHV